LNYWWSDFHKVVLAIQGESLYKNIDILSSSGIDWLALLGLIDIYHFHGIFKGIFYGIFLVFRAGF